MKTGGDTDLGGPGRRFPSTCWSLFLQSPDRRPGAGDELARSYWKPVYAYVRSKWAKTNEDAKDLTQEFFLWMTESDFASRADPARGRFRAFVKVALDHFVTSEARRKGAVKRGGDAKTLPLDDAPSQLAGLGIPDPAAQPPDRALDLAWRNDLMARAVARLERDLAAEGHEAWFKVFRDYHFGDGAEPRYADVAAKHGAKEGDVLNWLREARRRYRAVITDLVAETVESEDDLRAELRALFGEGW